MELIHGSVVDDKSSEILPKLDFMKREENKTVFAYTSVNDLQSHLYNNDSKILRKGCSDTDLF